MGHRIVSFLTDFLPQHPGLFRSPEVRERTRVELELLQECLEDVALRIDEEECNQFVANFDPAAIVVEDDDDDDVTEDSTVEDEDQDSVGARSGEMLTPPKGGSGSSSVGDAAKKVRVVHFEDWVAFPQTGKVDLDTALSDRKAAESPTAETVGTTGTGSIENLDASYFSSSSDEFGMETRKSPDMHSSARNRSTARSPYYVSDSEDDRSKEGDESAAYSSSRQMYPVHVSLDFLEKIANEEVEYETDSEAADSWAQGDGESAYNGHAVSSSGVAPTCDPARIAFRELMKRLPLKQSLLSDVLNKECGNSPSPTFLDILNKSIEAGTGGSASAPEDEVEGVSQKILRTEERVESEIQRYLESEEDDAEIFIETCHNNLRVIGPNSTHSSYSGEGSESLSSEKTIIPSSDSSFSRYTSSSKPSASSPSLQESRTSAFRPFDADDDDEVQAVSALQRSTFNSFHETFLEDDTWVAFDNSQSRVPVNFFASMS
jgi:hypothetical protein